MTKSYRLYFTGKDTENSGLDIWVDTTPKTTMFDLCGLQMELEDLLGIKVWISNKLSNVHKLFVKNIIN